MYKDIIIDLNPFGSHGIHSQLSHACRPNARDLVKLFLMDEREIMTLRGRPKYLKMVS